jgi:hypothetical protein
MLHTSNRNIIDASAVAFQKMCRARLYVFACRLRSSLSGCDPSCIRTAEESASIKHLGSKVDMITEAICKRGSICSATAFDYS